MRPVITFGGEPWNDIECIQVQEALGIQPGQSSQRDCLFIAKNNSVFTIMRADRTLFEGSWDRMLAYLRNIIVVQEKR